MGVSRKERRAARWCTRAMLCGISCAAFAASNGCATMIHAPVTKESDASDRGIRYYLLSPYLIAYSNGKGGVVTQIYYLPDPNKKMSVRPDTTLADVKSTLEFEHGALTTANDSGDATEVSKAVQTAVEKLGTALIGAGIVPRGLDEQPVTMPAPYIYKIVVKNGSVRLIGGSRAPAFHITLLPQPPGKKEEDQ